MIFLFQHLFSAIRARGGFNDHPTVRQAAAAIRVISSNSYLRRSTARNRSVEQEVTDFLLPQAPEVSSEQPQEEEKEEEEKVDVTTTVSDAATSSRQEEGAVAQSDEALDYVLGSFIRRLDCAKCSSSIGSLCSKEEGHGFQKLMTYDKGHLYEPSGSFRMSFSSLQKPILNYIQGNLCQKKIAAAIVKRFRLAQETVGCCSQEHTDQILMFYSQMLIRAVCKDLNQDFKKSCQKGKKKKLNIV